MPIAPMALEQRVERLAKEVSQERQGRQLLESSLQALRAEVALLREKVGADRAEVGAIAVAADPESGGAPALGSHNGGIGSSASLVMGDEGPVVSGNVGRASVRGDGELEEVSPQESVWDCAMLVFLPSIGWAGSLMLLLAIAVTILLQLVFLIVCAGSAFGNSLPSPDDARKWRITDGHRQEYMDTGGFVSLAARVCGKDDSLTFSNDQVDLVKTIENYRTPLPLLGDESGHALSSQGGALCFVVLFLWMNVVVADFHATVKYLHVIWHLPTSAKTLLHTRDNSSVLKSVAKPRRLCLVLAAVFRMGVACGIGYYGAKWLSNTIKITDLVVNAAALTFILDIDKMLFSTLVPLKAAIALRRLEPLRRPHPRSCKGLDLFSVLSFITCLLGSFVVFGFHASTLYNLLGDVNTELCGRGDLNFVVQVNTELGFPLMTWTNGYSRYSLNESGIHSSWFRNAVNSTISITEANPYNRLQAQDLLEQSTNVVPLAELRDDGIVGSKSQFNAYLQLRVTSFGVLSCEDQLITSPSLLNYLLDIYSRPDATGCHDFRHVCGDPDANTLRFACARTCGCHAVTSGLFALGGCPEICGEERRKRTAAMPCQSADDSHRDLVSAASAMAVNWENHPAVGQPPILSTALLHGCAGAVERLGATDRWRLDYLCNPLPGRASLAPLCPYECGCSDTNTLDGNCPLNCANQSVSPTACELGLCPYGELKSNVSAGPFQNISCASVDLLFFARLLTEPACYESREGFQAECCAIPEVPCFFCPIGTQLLRGSRVPPDGVLLANSSCAGVEAYYRSEDLCQTHVNRPLELLDACCGGINN